MRCSSGRFHSSASHLARCLARRTRRAAKAAAARPIINSHTALPLAHDASSGVYHRKVRHARTAAWSGVSPVISLNAWSKGTPPATRWAMAPGTSGPCRVRRSSMTVAASR
jgi:hypothetical protein